MGIELGIGLMDRLERYSGEFELTAGFEGNSRPLVASYSPMICGSSMIGAQPSLVCIPSKSARMPPWSRAGTLS